MDIQQTNTPTQQPKRLDQVRTVLRFRHYSNRTEQSYANRIIRTIILHMLIVWDWEFQKGKRWTEDMRQSQAFILKEVMVLERKAVVEIEEIVKAI